MPRRDEDSDSDEYVPGDSDTSSDDSSEEDVTLHIRSKTPSRSKRQPSEQPPHSRTSDKPAQTQPQSNNHRFVKPYQPYPIQRKEHPPTLPQKRTRTWTDDIGHANYAPVSTNGNGVPFASRKLPEPNPLVRQKQEALFGDYDMCHDSLFRTRQRCIGLLADLNVVKVWMENQGIYRDAPPFIRDILEQKQI